MPQYTGPIFGLGANGDKTVSTTEDITTTRSGINGNTSSGQKDIVLNDASGFAIGDYIFIHQSRGTNYGNNEFRYITNKVSNTITVNVNLDNSYTDDGGTQQSQVCKIPQYNSLKIVSGGSWQVTAWDGNKGGIAIVAVKGRFVVESGGSIDIARRGFNGGNDESSIGNVQAQAGESGTGDVVQQTSANGMGGGGARDNGGGNGASGGGGGNHEAGSAGGANSGHTPGAAGAINPYSNDGSKIVFPGAGGGGIGPGGNDNGGDGGDGAGILIILAKDFDCSAGVIYGWGEDGNSDGSPGGSQGSGGGGGGGGSFHGVFGKCNIGTDKLQLNAGLGGGSSGGNPAGGAGGKGRAWISAGSFTGSIATNLGGLTTSIGAKHWLGKLGPSN